MKVLFLLNSSDFEDDSKSIILEEAKTYKEKEN